MEDEFNPVPLFIGNSKTAASVFFPVSQQAFIEIMGDYTPGIVRAEIIAVYGEADDPFLEYRTGLNGGTEILVPPEPGKKHIEDPLIIIVPDKPGPVPHPLDDKHRQGRK
jgi:hypothetical protein